MELPKEIEVPASIAGATAAGVSSAPAAAEHVSVSLAQLMTVPASCANENERVSKAIAIMEKEGVGQIGVVRDGVLIRVLSRGDLRQLMGPFYGTAAMSARDKAVLGVQLGKICKSQKLISIPMNGSAAEAVELMIENKLKTLPVVDENGALRGFIQVHELLKLLRTVLRPAPVYEI